MLDLPEDGAVARQPVPLWRYALGVLTCVVGLRALAVAATLGAEALWIAVTPALICVAIGVATIMVRNYLLRVALVFLSALVVIPTSLVILLANNLCIICK